MIRERYFHSDPNAPEVALTSARLLLQTDRERRGLRERGLGGNQSGCAMNVRLWQVFRRLEELRAERAVQASFYASTNLPDWLAGWLAD